MTLIFILFALYVVLQVADAAITAVAMKLPGAREANPILAKLFAKFGVVPTLVVVKVGVVLLLWAYLDVVPMWAVAALNTLYIYAVIRNIKGIRMLRDGAAS